MRAIVLGIGNTILSDEGVGVRAAAALQERYAIPDGVSVVDGGTAGMELLDIIAGVDLLIVLDTVKAGGPAGSIVRLSAEHVPVFFRKKLSPHQIGLCDVLAALEFSGDLPAEVVVLGVEPATLELGLELTDAVRQRVPRLAELAVAELAARGIALRSRAAAH
ncbi:hydrogenase 2 maturation protease [mine drainage metagenome]|jgi:hydrogenase maturation protease|uniref:Hydrogenase 2 maturation protease n=1 Tax=mine drainage metagenome TaxID=410659 RepID=A0A1J5RP21_9ZZZZ